MSASAPRDHLQDVHARVGAPRDDREPARVGREGRGLRLHLRGRIRQADLLPQPFFVFLAKYLPSWPPSPEIRTARAKFTDFLIF